MAFSHLMTFSTFFPGGFIGLCPSSDPKGGGLNLPLPPKKTGGMPLKVVGMDGWDGWMDSHG